MPVGHCCQNRLNRLHCGLRGFTLSAVANAVSVQQHTFLHACLERRWFARYSYCYKRSMLQILSAKSSCCKIGIPVYWRLILSALAYFMSGL